MRHRFLTITKFIVSPNMTYQLDYIVDRIKCAGDRHWDSVGAVVVRDNHHPVWGMHRTDVGSVFPLVQVVGLGTLGGEDAGRHRGWAHDPVQGGLWARGAGEGAGAGVVEGVDFLDLGNCPAVAEVEDCLLVDQAEAEETTALCSAGGAVRGSALAVD